MNKTELINEVYKGVNLSKGDINQVVNVLFETIAKTIAAGDAVIIAGFGKFDAVARKERMSKNPKTGETVIVPEHLAPVFKPGKLLRDTINTKG